MNNRNLVNLLTILTSFFFIILILEIFFRFMPVINSIYWGVINQDNPVLRHNPNTIITYSKDWNFKYKTNRKVNNYGFLNDQNYISESKNFRISVIGDSYVETFLNSYENTFYGKLENSYKSHTNVYSFGVSGAQLSQYLSWIEYVNENFNSDLFIIPIIANDFDESFYKYKKARGFHYFDEKKLDGSLYLVDRKYSLIRKLIFKSSFFRYIFFHLNIGDILRNTKIDLINFFSGKKTNNRYIGNIVAIASEEQEKDGYLASNLFFKKLNKLNTNKKPIIFILDAIRPSIYDPNGLDQIAINSFWNKMRIDFKKKAKVNGYLVLDMQPIFKNHFKKNNQFFEFKKDGHWNDLAHSVIHQSLLDFFDLNNLFDEK
jgi:hypothetical protein